MRCSPSAAFLTPIESLIFDFLGTSGSWGWWDRSPRWWLAISISASIVAILIPASCAVFACVGDIFRTLVGPVSGLATLVAIALFGLIRFCRRL